MPLCPEFDIFTGPSQDVMLATSWVHGQTWSELLCYWDSSNVGAQDWFICICYSGSHSNAMKQLLSTFMGRNQKSEKWDAVQRLAASQQLRTWVSFHLILKIKGHTNVWCLGLHIAFKNYFALFEPTRPTRTKLKQWHDLTSKDVTKPQWLKWYNSGANTALWTNGQNVVQK